MMKLYIGVMGGWGEGGVMEGAGKGEVMGGWEGGVMGRN